MKLYCGMNRKGVWKASANYKKVRNFNNVFESDVETVHNGKVYMIKTYYGFDYNYSQCSIYDVVEYTHQLYHSVLAAKKNPMWKERAQLAKEKPGDYHVTPFSIATDYFGHPFAHGDAMSGDFNMEIITLKVI